MKYTADIDRDDDVRRFMEMKCFTEVEDSHGYSDDLRFKRELAKKVVFRVHLKREPHGSQEADRIAFMITDKGLRFKVEKDILGGFDLESYFEKTAIKLLEAYAAFAGISLKETQL